MRRNSSPYCSAFGNGGRVSLGTLPEGSKPWHRLYLSWTLPQTPNANQSPYCISGITCQTEKVCNPPFKEQYGPSPWEFLISGVLKLGHRPQIKQSKAVMPGRQTAQIQTK